MARVLALKRVLYSMLIAFTATGCAAQPARDVDWHDRDSYAGWVTDAETGEPLEGAVVVAAWNILQRHPLHSKTVEVIRLDEAITDKEGRFEFAPLGAYTPPAGWERDEGAFPVLHFFKPGYEPTGYQRFTWEFGQDARLPRKSEQHAARKVGWQREIQLYRYLTGPVSDVESMNPIYQRMSDSQKILGPLKSFANFLARNVENSDSELAPFGNPRTRKAIEAQWRAILMVDAEIRKYEPNHHWRAGIGEMLRSRASTKGSLR
jgi:hypothetical protein